jgi:pyridoxine 5-phosphate synthase
VPDDPNQLTSDHGWDTIKHKTFLIDTIERFHEAGIRTSIFVDPDEEMVRHAKDTGTDRIELYTESYAANFLRGKEEAIHPFMEAANAANDVGLGLNAGHDLNLVNLNYFARNIPGLLEVSIGHALICDALYFGLENAVQLYLRALRDKKAEVKNSLPA